MQRRLFLQAGLGVPAVAAWRKQAVPARAAELRSLMDSAPVPGAIAGCLLAGRLAWTMPLGVRDFESKTPVDSDTLFQAASLSKQITAYAAFALRAEGKLDFEKPLVRYVDDLADSKARLVTARHVLSHSAGFPNWRFEKGSALVPEFAPGERFQYSGEGYFYLQRVMEHVTGMGFGKIIRSLVFEPLGMTSSAVASTPALADRMALPHDRRGELRKDWDKDSRRIYDIAAGRGTTTDAWRYADYLAATVEMGGRPLPNWILPNAAASMVTTASDYSKFLIAAMRNTEYRKEVVRIRPALGWGLGWGIERVNGREYLWQWGDNGGYKNIVFAEAAEGNAIFVFTNGDSGRPVYDRIVTDATGHDHPALFWI
jgi:CubicO group peptidase (beta-lactamase class C family)